MAHTRTPKLAAKIARRRKEEEGLGDNPPCTTCSVRLFPKLLLFAAIPFRLRFQASVCSFSIGDGLELRHSPRIRCLPL